LARCLADQLGKLPGFEQASTRFEKDNQRRWATLDGWIRHLAGPLSLYHRRVVVLIDGFDRVAGTVNEVPLRRALSELLDVATNVNVVVLGRADPQIAGATVVAMPDVTEETAKSYLASRGVNSADHDRLVAMAAGRWLVLDLAAAAHGRVSNERLYDDLVGRARNRAGGLVDQVVDLLAAAGTGPFLPIDVLRAALGETGDPIALARLNEVLGDTDLYRVVERTLPGTAGDRLGLYHQSLTDYVIRRSDLRRAHRAIADALDRLAPASRHDPKKFRDDPALAYAFDAQPRHRWEAGQSELVVSSLVQRTDVVPTVNLVRWTGWSARLQESLGSGHPDTLRSRNNVAAWTGSAGDAGGALAILEALLPDMDRVLGPDHPDALRSRDSLAYWTGSAGDARGALAILEALLPDMDRVLGPDHPDTLITRDNLAALHG
jgi:hypothetical protein